MSLLSKIAEGLVGLTDEAVEAITRRFATAADTPANRSAVQREIAAARQAAGSGVRRAQTRLPSASPNPFAVAVERVRRQPAQEARAVPQSLEARKRERPRVEALTVETTPNRVAPPEVSIYDLEGQPFITSMSDLSAAGDEITAVNDVPLGAPVERQGGQDYMFDNDAVWAADRNNAAAHMGLAARLLDETGSNPLFFPWAMGPRAIDFSHMPRELMLQVAVANAGRRERDALGRDIRAVLPDFRDVEDPASLSVFRAATGAQRGELNRLLDQRRDAGGMGIGEARLAMSDPEQLGVPLTSLRNVGRIDARGAIGPSAHPSYNTAIPGEGIGRLRENIGALELLPELRQGLDDPFGFPVGVVPGQSSPLRSLQMKPRGGVLTDYLLRAVERRQRALEQGGYADGGRVSEGKQTAAPTLPLGVMSRVKNADGSTSTVRTMSIGTDQGEVLIPTVYGNRQHSEQEAVKRYEQTGGHFGVYNSVGAADRAAERLHNSHARKLAAR